MNKAIKVNKEKIEKKMQLLDALGCESWSDHEAFGRCLAYFGEQEKAETHFREAAGAMEALLAKFEQDNRKEFLRLKLVRANLYRLAGEHKTSSGLYDELAEELQTLFVDRYKGDQERGISILANLSTCHFFLEEYEKAILYGKMVTEWFPPSLGYAEGILHSNRKRIEFTLEHVAREIKSDKSLPYYTGAEVSLWDWYAIGKGLLQSEAR